MKKNLVVIEKPVKQKSRGLTKVEVFFKDEGVDLEGTIHVVGDKAAVSAYIEVYESDLRRNFADLFPAPPMPSSEGGMRP